MSEWLTQAELANRLGITSRQVHNLAKGVPGQPAIPTRMRKNTREYRWPESNQWYIDYKLAVAKPKTEEDEREAAQIRKLLAEAALKELELAREEGSLLDADYVEQQLTGILERLRSRILAARGRFAPRFVGIRTVGEAQIMLEKMSDELLDALREIGDDPTLDPDGDGEEEAEDAAGEAAGAR